MDEDIEEDTDMEDRETEDPINEEDWPENFSEHFIALCEMDSEVETTDELNY